MNEISYESELKSENIFYKLFGILALLFFIILIFMMGIGSACG